MSPSQPPDAPRRRTTLSASDERVGSAATLPSHPPNSSGAHTVSYFVTGATGFIGRFLVQDLIDNREGEIFVLVRGGSQAKLDRLMGTWGHSSRVTPVVGDLTAPALGVDEKWVADHRGKIDHFV